MTTVVVIHGTGVRADHYSALFLDIESSLHAERPDVTVLPCAWGDHVGVKLEEGLSIPDYEQTLGPDYISDEDIENTLWEQLYKDPLYELRLLALLPEPDTLQPIQSPGDELRRRVGNLLPSTTLKEVLTRAGILAVFNDAWMTIIGSASYRQALQLASQPVKEYILVIARAIVAQALIEQESLDIYTPALIDARLRDEVVAALGKDIATDKKKETAVSASSQVAVMIKENARSVSSHVREQLKGLAFHIASHRMERKRGALMNYSYAPAGDILLYQVRGEQIRDYIRSRIKSLPVEEQVVILAHSLGGIAAVDLLVKEHLPQVKYLITVGSQAPFLYEIDALYSLRYRNELREELPFHFPPWLNIYDPRDLLSYIAEAVFKHDKRIEDIPVNNGLPFPQSHGGYWRNPQTWNAVLLKLPRS